MLSIEYNPNNMKIYNIILFFCLTCVVTLKSETTTSITPVEKNTFTVTFDMEDGTSLDTSFKLEEDHLCFSTEEVIDILQIYNSDDKLVFQLPVSSATFKIGKSLFEKGDYTLGFLLSNQNSLKFTKIKVL